MTNSILEVQTCYNPFFIDGREVHSIILYNDKGIVFKTRSGWFGNNNNFRGGLEIPEAISKRKIDLSLKKCFYVPVPPEDWKPRGKYVDLYLYIDGENIKFISENRHAENMTDCEIWHYVNLDFEIFGHVIQDYYIEKFEKTDFGQKVESTAEELKKAGIKIDSWDLKELLRKYDLVKKD